METKIDGLSMALRYENGNLVTAITRGDGRNFGEDVTANAKVIDDVAVTLRDPIPYLELRGEVYMTNAAFDTVNERQELLGKKPFANPRATVPLVRCASWMPPLPRSGTCPFLCSTFRTSRGKN